MRDNYQRFRPPGQPQHDFGRRDPRQFGQGVSSSAADLLHGEAVEQSVAREGVVPLAKVIENLNAYNLPPQLVQGSFLVWITAAGRAGQQLLIPKNPNRLGFLVSNFVGAASVLFSFDQPMPMQSGALSTQLLAGVPIGSCYQEANGSVSVNDIWVFCNDTVGDFPIPILGYESNLSITGNKA